MPSGEDTIAALATSPGESALGVIRVSGRAAMGVVGSIFEPAKAIRFSDVPSHTCHFGRIQSRQPVDQVVVTVFRAPKSATGEDVVEISAHGSPYGLRSILALCLKSGARLAEPGEFTLRAFTNGKLDLAQAEAVADMIHARTSQAHRAAAAQLEGSLSREVRKMRDRVLPLLAHVEVGLDHSDEDHPFLPPAELEKACAEVLTLIETLLASARLGKILREGLRVAIVGRPNVGKSSLLNALLKEDRAIVTPIPGTTRDTLEESVNWDGIPVVLTDTAGLREGLLDPVEKIGMDRARRAVEGSDMVLAVFDGTQQRTDEDDKVLKLIKGKTHLKLLNKCDQPSLRQEGDLRISAKTGTGLDQLVACVKAVALRDNASGARWLLNARHADALRRAHAALQNAWGAGQRRDYEECVALELKTALAALGEIVGETTTDDLLSQIFSRFCVGK